MVLEKVVVAAALWMLMSIGCCAKVDNTGCPESFKGRCKCGNITSIYSSTNKFTVSCTDSGFTNASMLQDIPENTEILIFTGNNVPELPFNIFNNYLKLLDVLETVDMSNNNIRFIQGKSFHKVYNVKTLILNHNALEITDKKERPRIFSNFESLENLHLTNAFTEDTNASDYLLSLDDIFYESELRLSGKAMTELDSFVKNVSSFEIKLEENPFVCDCRSSNFIHWLNSTPVVVRDWKTFVCRDGYPDSNTGQLLSKVHKLSCPSSGKINNKSNNLHTEKAFHDTANYHGGHHIIGYSSATIGALSFFLVFTSSMLLAVAYFHKQKIKAIVAPCGDFLTRNIGYTGISGDETPREVNV
ncbi:SLIT and NTRK-like protein 2-like [Homarus americanus]|uniref:SLIT and NTRK-like protein 2-like n=1 Tax=Homarus americanus TaxID=6706 RepID=A0A8J5N7J3_HOMAM|nr:SLIT and NTRK-like protein 2-like [Homarus americanus]